MGKARRAGPPIWIGTGHEICRPKPVSSWVGVVLNQGKCISKTADFKAFARQDF